jgi:Predicted ATPase
LEELISRAKLTASSLGEVVGIAARVQPISHGEEERRIRVEVPFDTYLAHPLRVGQYLGLCPLVSGVAMLGRVVEVERADIMAVARVPAIGVGEDPSAISTPLVLTLELISEEVGGEVLPPSSPVDPQSPVFLPSRDFLERTLGLPSSGVEVGEVLEGSLPRADVKVRLTEEVLRHHVLVVGTTGSGKTNLLRLLAFRSPYNTVVFDLQGDYVQVAAKRRGLLLLPVSSQHVAEARGLVNFVQFVLSNSALGKFKLTGADQGGVLTVSLENGGELRVMPTALRLMDSYKQLAEVSPVFSPQAAYFFPQLVENCRPETIREFPECLELKDQLKLHRATAENLERSVYLLESTGVIDVNLSSMRRERNYLSSPDPEALLKEPIVVVDLRWVAERGMLAVTLVAFTMLESLFSAKDAAYKRGEGVKNTLLIFDEAHEYFPQGRREENKEGLERLINRVLRLGRVRGIGSVLATHRPEDLNDLVLTLTNTKIALRSEEESLKRIGMDQFSNFLRVAPTGAGVMRTFAYRVPEILFRANKYQP